MSLPWTLSLYISRHFLQAILLALAGLLCVTTLVDVVELLRRAAGKEALDFSAILVITLLKLPSVAERLMPYAVLVGSMLALTRLTRTHELVIARAAGVSVWQFLAPALLLVMGLGVFITVAFGPVASVLLLRHEKLENRYFANQPSLLAISSSGLWLRQVEPKGEHIIYALKISQSDMSFSNVIVFTFNEKDIFVERLDADHAALTEDNLHLTRVVRSVPGKPPEALPEYDLPTTLTLDRIQDSFASPETMSFWGLPEFIQTLQEAGFSALKHRLYWQSLLANPFLMAGTVLVAAVFSLRQPRRGKVGLLIVAGIVSGFLLHFFTNVIFSFGAAGALPVWLAAWAPACVVGLIGAGLLLHLEDG